MNSLDKQYTTLLQDILDNCHQKGDRTGTGTISVFGRQIRHKMSEGFPLLTTKKMYFKGIVTELLWFLRGDTNIKYLVDNDCNIWNGDAYKKYLNTYKGNFEMDMQEFVEAIKSNPEFAKAYGDLGPVYGKQWRNWERYGYRGVQNGALDCGIITMDEYKKEKYIDQIENLIYDLKTNPDSRRLMVNAWNVGELDSMVLPPCHYGFQVYTRELSFEERKKILRKTLSKRYPPLSVSVSMKMYEGDEAFKEIFETENIPTRAISLMWNQRSVDTFLGLPFNIASYGLLLEIIAKVVNMVPDELIGNLGDTHLYSNHVEQAKEQIGRALSIEERIDLASKKYDNFDIMDFGIPFTCTHEDIDKFYPVERRTREPFPLPKLDIHPGMLDYDLDKLEINMFKILDYQSHPTIKAQISN